MCASRTAVVLFMNNIVCNIKENVANAKSTYKKNVLELVVGVLQEKRHACTWRMLNVCSKERSFKNVIRFYLLLVVVIDRNLLFFF